MKIIIEIEGNELTEQECRVLAALGGAWPQAVTAAEVAPPVAPGNVLDETPTLATAASLDGSSPAEEQPVRRHRRTKAEMEAARAAAAAGEQETPPGPSAGGDSDEPATVPSEADVNDQPDDEADVLGSAVPPAATLDDAVKIATQMVADGRVADIKEFLTELGAKRVSELKGDGINRFVAKFSL